MSTPIIADAETKTKKTAGRSRAGGLNLLQETLTEGARLLTAETDAPGVAPFDSWLLPPTDPFSAAAGAAAFSSLLTFEEPAAAPGEFASPAEAGPLAADAAPCAAPADCPPTATPEDPPIEISEAELRRAADLLALVAASPHPAQDVADNLETIEDLLPALMEINIRQAHADGRPNLAAALRALLDSAPLQQRALAVRRQSARLAAEARRPRRVLFLAPGEDSALQQSLPAGALANLGVDVTLATRFPPDFQSQVDLVIARHPHENPELLKDLAACAAVGIPIILDLDVDVEQMPLDHPQYPALGLSTQLGARAYNAALLLAGQVRVPNTALAAPFRARGCKVHVIPNGWSRDNRQWEKPAPERAGLQIGWIQSPGEYEDIAAIRRIILRALREFPQSRLVISGDPRAYQMFDSLPESRRLYLPPVSLEDQPYLLRQIDILLVPLRQTPFNATQPDDRLMEAGLRGIPWVASPVPAFSEWGQGGLLAASPDEWHSHLRQLMLDETSRAALGMAGRMKAESREISRLAKHWIDLIEETLT